MSSLPILVLNSGSSSIKFAMYEAADGQRTKIFEGAVDGIATDNGKFWIKDAEGKKLIDETPDLPNRSVAFALVAKTLNSGKFPQPKAIGHRTVSGSPTVLENQLITPELIDDLDKYADLAPLHTPIAVYIMREALKLFPGIPNFAVLDTYFHRTMPEVVKRMPIPDEYVDMGVRRYGYHGISYESIIHQLQPDIPEKLIVAHLGNGASLAAVRDGVSIDTSMGFTPAAGLVMSRTRAPVRVTASRNASASPNTVNPATCLPLRDGSSSRNPTGSSPASDSRCADRATIAPADPAPYRSARRRNGGAPRPSWARQLALARTARRGVATRARARRPSRIQNDLGNALVPAIPSGVRSSTRRRSA